MGLISFLKWAGVVITLYAFVGRPTPHKGSALMLGLASYLIGLFLGLV